MSVPSPPLIRGKWPKILPPLTSEQERISDDFMRHWHEVLPHRFGAIEKFNHLYPVRCAAIPAGCRTLEIGAGLGEHLHYEPLDRQEYYCLEIRQNMADAIKARFPQVNTVVGDCQEHLPFEDSYFDRVLAVHVLEHLPNLPAAIAELRRVLKPSGVLAVVMPCDPGLLYEIARKISAERIFRQRYKQSYQWFIRREHINSPYEIEDQLTRRFHLTSRQYFPFRIPVTNLNLCIGLIARPIK
jgi:SAM-dependent methyltransferase